MIVIKNILLFVILFTSTSIGILISNKYSNRVKELKEMKIGLNIFNAKIKFTYEPIPKIFNDIALTISENSNISKIFLQTSKKIQEEQLNAGEAWKNSIHEVKNYMNKEDLQILENLSNLLGKVDLEGQVSEINLVENFLDTQIEKAEIEKTKNAKMYKTLGITSGLAMVIFLF